MFSGKKTYIVCLLAVLWAVIGGFTDKISWIDASQMIEVALIGAGLRHGMTQS